RSTGCLLTSSTTRVTWRCCSGPGPSLTRCCSGGRGLRAGTGPPGMSTATSWNGACGGSEAGLSGLAVLAGRVEDLARYATAVGGDGADADVRKGYAQDLPERPWPPGRNEACWCGSGVKYKKCCLARTRR